MALKPSSPAGPLPDLWGSMASLQILSLHKNGLAGDLRALAYQANGCPAPQLPTLCMLSLHGACLCYDVKLLGLCDQASQRWVSSMLKKSALCRITA